VFNNRERILDFLLEKEKEIKGQDTVVMNLFTIPWMMYTNNIDNITHVLKNVDTFGKGPDWITRFSSLLGNGIFNADGAVWYKHRKTSAHLFKLNTFKHEMVDTFDAHCNELVDVIKTKGGKPFDVQVCCCFSLHSSPNIVQITWHLHTHVATGPFHEVHSRVHWHDRFWCQIWSAPKR
jgi:cytochrome P450